MILCNPMRDPREENPFESVPTAKPGEFAGLLWVHEDRIRGDTTLAAGTTLANAFTGAPKGDAIRRGFGAYVFTDFAGKSGGWHGFWFARVFSNGEKTTAFRTTTDIRQGIPWPAVLQSIATTPFLAYDSNGSSYTADTIWEFGFKDAYDGPTKVTIEYFASHEPHTITVPTTMRPQGGTFDYGAGSVTFPPCLHPVMNFTFNTGTTSSRYPYQIISRIFQPTNVPDWPSTLVIEDGEVFSNGLYIRRKVTATAPY